MSESYVKDGASIGCKYLTDADLGKSTGSSSQTHFGLLEGVFDQTYDSSVKKNIPIYVCGAVGSGTMCLDFIENPDGSLRSPKIRIGRTDDEKFSNIAREIRSLSVLFPQRKWFLIYSENRYGVPFFAFFVQNSYAWNEAEKLGIDFDELDKKVIKNISSEFLKLSSFLTFLFEGKMIQGVLDYSNEYTSTDTLTESQLASDFSPEWFEEKSLEFPMLNQEAQDFITIFLSKFSVEKLSKLEGIKLLNGIFLNQNNKSNLCYVLEFDSTCRSIFGSIKSGTSYKYGLHYNKKNGSWATGSNVNPVLLTEEQAIELGTQIRDYLVAGAELIKETSNLATENDYFQLYNDLDDITDGYINRVWFLKYYALLFPDLFPPIYSYNAQINVLKKLKIETMNNAVCRLAGIADFAKKCNISNVMFGKIFWTYCTGDAIQTEEIPYEGEEMKNCLEIERMPRKNSLHPLNMIIYGAPGTGKTYSTTEYALAIIENRSVDLSYKTEEQRRKVMQSYNNYVKSGQVVFTTFHQSYGYEEFIQGLRPDMESDDASFKIVDGVFKRIADEALQEKNASKNYVIVIDEINRANISKVFGELITLIEEDKRWGEVNQTCVTLQSGDIFSVPNNLYIVGTMNSADKSISLIDAALRRRFEFVEQKPISELVKDEKLHAIFVKLNDTLAEELQSSDLLVGHSYFMGKTIDDLEKIFNNSIIPLLYEYFYDNKKKVLSVLNNVLKDTNFKPLDAVIGRVYVKKG